MSTTPAITSDVAHEKRGCRYCGGREVHLASCPLDDKDADYASLVLDSERAIHHRADTPAEHVLITPKTCDCDKLSDHPCPVCDSGLAICSVCNKAEAELGDGPCIPQQPAGDTPAAVEATDAPPECPNCHTTANTYAVEKGVYGNKGIGCRSCHVYFEERKPCICTDCDIYGCNPNCEPCCDIDAPPQAADAPERVWLPRFPIERSGGFHNLSASPIQINKNDIEYISAAAHDAEVDRLREALRDVALNTVADGDCWCASNGEHADYCLKARAAIEGKEQG